MLKITTILLLLGRAWQHLVWHTPHSEFFWDETWWGGLVNSFGLTWNDYANNYMDFIMIENFVSTIGILYIITAIGVVFYKKEHWWTSVLLILSSLNLIFLAFCYMKGKSFAIGQFWEYTIQFMTPILLWLWVQQKLTNLNWLLLAKVCIAFSFTCHGLYAIGFYPVPGNFVDMTISITGLSQANSYIYLFIAGILDFIIAIGIFAPNQKIVKGLLIYAIFWGLTTSLARIFAYARIAYFWDPFWQWLPHTIYRLPHGLIPLVALLVLIYYQKQEKLASKLNLELLKK